MNRSLNGSAFLTGAAGALPSRTVAVLEAIKRAILAGELKPGRPLVETDLAEVLGVSKTPVREALKTLAGAGLVTMHPYKGALVSVAACRNEPDWRPTPSWEREAAEHRAVLKAAQDGDAHRAAGLLRGHITSFVQRNFPATKTQETQEENH